MKTQPAPADENRQTPSAHEKTTQPENQQPAAVQPPLSESPKSQLHVYQQLRKMDSELAADKDTANTEDK